MSDDLVVRLRTRVKECDCLEAADEIERLSTAGKALVIERDLWRHKAEAAEAQIAQHQAEWEQAVSKAEAAEAEAAALREALSKEVGGEQI